VDATCSSEPGALRLGKLFGDFVVAGYLGDVSGVTGDPEHYIKQRSAGTARWKPDGSLASPVVLRGGGFIDLLLEVQHDGDRPWFVVLEVKNTDWDLRALHRVIPNLRRHARQLWGYLEPLVVLADAGELEQADGVLIYPRRPTTPGRAELIEAYLGERGIIAAYYDEL
jgi:hypothetical protein